MMILRIPRGDFSETQSPWRPQSMHRRLKHEEEFDAVVLAYNPIIISTLKIRIYRALSEQGYVSVARAAEPVEHLTRGLNKSVPAECILTSLRAAGVGFIRVMQFGMKQKMEEFPAVIPYILQ